MKRAGAREPKPRERPSNAPPDLVARVRLDRSAIALAMHDDPRDDIEYWRTRTVEQRLEHLELLRQINYGYDPATARLQRVLEYVELE